MGHSDGSEWTCHATRATEMHSVSCMASTIKAHNGKMSCSTFLYGFCWQYAMDKTWIVRVWYFRERPSRTAVPVRKAWQNFSKSSPHRFRLVYCITTLSLSLSLSLLAAYHSRITNGLLSCWMISGAYQHVGLDRIFKSSRPTLQFGLKSSFTSTVSSVSTLHLDVHSFTSFCEWLRSRLSSNRIYIYI